MNNSLKVSLENIIPLTEARDHFSQIVTEVQKDKLYVLTKGGKPAVAIIDVKYLETLTGGQVKPEHVEEEIMKDPAKVGRTPMIEHVMPAIPKEDSLPGNFNMPPKIEEKSVNPTPPPVSEKPASILPPGWDIPASTPPAPKPLDVPSTPTPAPIPAPPTPTPVPAPEPPKPVAPPAAHPLSTMPSGATIEVVPAADDDVIAKNTAEDNKHSDGSTSADNQVGPAQYAGEPEDMGLD